jgi:penicillin-binding protein-related factor A (putative recombinase)
MQKGRAFEKQVEKVADYINASGGHAHKNHAERTLEGTYIKGEPFDWEMFMPNYHCAFDTKECQSDTWNMKPKDIVQAENLKHCRNAGLEAYFLIYFNNKEVKQIDIDDVIEVLKTGKKSISKSLGKEWELLARLKNVEKH